MKGYRPTDHAHPQSVLGVPPDPFRRLTSVATLRRENRLLFVCALFEAHYYVVIRIQRWRSSVLVGFHFNYSET